MERQPEEPPEWVDTLANQVETQRLTAMEVLIKEELYPEAVQDSLTTKFAHDWCAKGLYNAQWRCCEEVATQKSSGST